LQKPSQYFLKHMQQKSPRGTSKSLWSLTSLKPKLLGIRYQIDLFTSNDENSTQHKTTKSIASVSHAHLACRLVPGKWLITTGEEDRLIRSPLLVPDQRRQECQPCDHDHDVKEVVGLHRLIRAASKPLVLRPDLLLHRVG